MTGLLDRETSRDAGLGDGALTPNEQIGGLLVLMMMMDGVMFMVGYRWLGGIMLVILSSYGYFWYFYPMIDLNDDVGRVIGVMKSHPKMKQAQMEGLASLFEKTKDCDGSENVLVEVQDQNGLDTILDAAETFENDVEVVERVFGVLANVSAFPLLRKGILDANVSVWSISKLEEFIDREVACKYGLLLFSILTESELRLENPPEKYCAKHAISVILTTMYKHKHNEKIQRWGNVSLLHILGTDEEYYESFLNHDGVEILLQTIKLHSDDEPILSLSLGLIVTLMSKNLLRVDDPQNAHQRQTLISILDGIKGKSNANINPSIAPFIQHLRNKILAKP